MCILINILKYTECDDYHFVSNGQSGYMPIAQVMWHSANPQKPN